LKSLILYFSVTGNTEKIAHAILKGISDAGSQCEIATYKEVSPKHLFQYQLIGFGCPIYGFVEPLNVRMFISELRGVGGKHAFTFATHGTRPEFFLPSIVTRMRRKGLVVIGFYTCYADVQIGDRRRVYPTAGHPDAIDLKEAEDFGRDVVRRSQRIHAGEVDLIPSLPSWVEYRVEKYKKDRVLREIELGVPREFAERNVFSPLQYDKGKCKYPACHRCMEACPVDGLDITVDPPLLGKPCMNCNICIRTCPNGALTREMHFPTIPPEVSRAVFEEFYLKPLARAEAEGRFRRLVPLDQVTSGFNHLIFCLCQPAGRSHTKVCCFC